MRGPTAILLAATALSLSPALAQSADFQPPSKVEAGSAFSIQTSGTGDANLYIVGPGQALHQDVHLGTPASFAAGTLYRSGSYLAILVAGSTTQSAQLDVTPASKVETLGFIAKPSRLPVGLHNGISGTVYVFDPYQNLILTPVPVQLQLSNNSAVVQSRTVQTRDGLAWSEMDSAPKEGAAKFIAEADGISSTRVIEQVPGDPCSISITAQPSNGKIEVQTAPIHDCGGNPVPDGTIVTFTEVADNKQSTVDVPLKKGVARAAMPAYSRAKISVASGVVAGNEINWAGR